jgi:hypothetical protein
VPTAKTSGRQAGGRRRAWAHCHPRRPRARARARASARMAVSVCAQAVSEEMIDFACFVRLGLGTCRGVACAAPRAGVGRHMRQAARYVRGFPGRK